VIRRDGAHRNLAKRRENSKDFMGDLHGSLEMVAVEVGENETRRRIRENEINVVDRDRRESQNGEP
jgi:hypothetical protein